MDALTEKAVSIHQVRLSHGFLTKFDVLKGVDLDVNAGIIYGLLGPSGCGKTTLLKCIVGTMFPDFGLIKVFGETPGLISSKIPGSGVGYMPQELALFQMLTIAETLNYFGCLHHMKVKEVKCRIDFLLDFLNLPRKGRQINNLSGGQQRRVSFAVAMLHEPPLLILDEPTAGVDPLLRESIWQYLVQLCATKGVTVIITTHYIEEAREANKIGLMRNGKILLEEAPTTLLERYNLTTLEDVYVKICREDDKVNLQNQLQKTPDGKKSILHVNTRRPSSPYGKAVSTPAIKRGLREYFAPLSATRIKGLVHKNFIKMRRNVILLIFQFLLPVISFCAFCTMVDGEPKQTPVAVFNEDFYYGPQFLIQLSNVTVKQVPITSLDEGIALVTNGDAVAVIHIWKNFTSALSTRCDVKSIIRGTGDCFFKVVNSCQEMALVSIYISGLKVETQGSGFTAHGAVPDDITHAGSIHLRLDYTNQQITYFFQKNLYDALFRFIEATLKEVKRFPQIITPIIDIQEPIYGDTESLHITEFVVLGLIVSLANLMAIGLTSLAFVVDKNDGLLDRSYVSGVTSLEIMCSHMITQICVVMGQVVLILILALYVFNIHYIGSIWIFILIVLLQAMQGMAFGFVISVICKEEKSAVMLTISFFFPALLFSGTLWPLLATPHFIHSLANLLPQTMAVDSVRWVILRGRDLLWTPVWSGVLSTVLWMIFYLLLSITLMGFK